MLLESLWAGIQAKIEKANTNDGTVNAGFLAAFTGRWVELRGTVSNP
jgi:hypothetical protein